MTGLPLSAGNRFFWVGQHHCASDSTDCTDASRLVAAALAPQRRCHQQATSLGAASHSSSSFSLASFIDSQCQPPNAADSTLSLLPTSSCVPCQKGTWSPPDTPSLCNLSLTMPSLAASDSEALQGLVSEPMIYTTGHFLAASPFDTMDMSEDSNMWAADCLPEDVDKLLDWAADSAADSAFSDPSLDSAQLSMPCYELPQHSFELQSEAQGVHSQTSTQPGFNLDKPSTGCDNHTMTTAAQECPVSTALPRNPCSDEPPYTDSPQAASQQAELLQLPDLNCDQSPWIPSSRAATSLLYDTPASDAPQHQQLASNAPQHQQLVSDAPQHQLLASDAPQHQQLASPTLPHQQLASDAIQHQQLASDALQHQQLVSDALQHQQLVADAPQHQQLPSDALQHHLLASDAHQHQLLASDPLGLLMQREQELCFGALPTLSGRDSSPSSGSDEQTGVPGVKGQRQMKKRCGRPRVYDLDRPVPPGELKGFTLQLCFAVAMLG